MSLPYQLIIAHYMTGGRTEVLNHRLRKKRDRLKSADGTLGSLFQRALECRELRKITALRKVPTAKKS